MEKLGYRFGTPRQGDVVVFESPSASWDRGYESTRSSNTLVRTLENAGSILGIVAPDENDLVKRVIATGGQRVQCCDSDGNILVDGAPLTEPYVKSDFAYAAGALACDTAVRSARCFAPVTVPQGSLWVMGDNRDHSADSRFHQEDEFGGTVPVDAVIGRAVLILLPPSRWGFIR